MESQQPPFCGRPVVQHATSSLHTEQNEFSNQAHLNQGTLHDEPQCPLRLNGLPRSIQVEENTFDRANAYERHITNDQSYNHGCSSRPVQEDSKDSLSKDAAHFVCGSRREGEWIRSSPPVHVQDRMDNDMSRNANGGEYSHAHRHDSLHGTLNQEHPREDLEDLESSQLAKSHGEHQLTVSAVPVQASSQSDTEDVKPNNKKSRHLLLQRDDNEEVIGTDV